MPSSRDRNTHPNTYLVEHYRPDQVSELGCCVAELRERWGSADPARLLPRLELSVIVAADEAFFVVVSADSEQQVRDAYRQAGQDFDRISLAVADLAPVIVHPSKSASGPERTHP